VKLIDDLGGGLAYTSSVCDTMRRLPADPDRDRRDEAGNEEDARQIKAGSSRT
jgi:hypothetical protein